MKKRICLSLLFFCFLTNTSSAFAVDVNTLEKERQVVIEDMPLAGTLSLVTSVLPEGEGTKLFYSEKSLFDIGKIICDR